MSKFNLQAIPTAHGFAVCDCGEPSCGIHLVALDDDDNAIMQMILPNDIIPDIIRNFQNILYLKAVESDDDGTRHH